MNNIDKMDQILDKKIYDAGEEWEEEEEEEESK
jgi:hypothetical protein